MIEPIEGEIFNSDSGSEIDRDAYALSRYGVAQAVESDSRTRHLRIAISTYAVLWLIEGGLRRWVFPDIADALLVVRDPVVIFIYVLAAQAGMLRLGAVEIVALFLVIFSFLATFFFGHANLVVALYGARTLILHIPLIYVMGRALDIRYVNNIARAVLFVLPFMTALLVEQFYSPQSAFVNIGLGGVGSAGFSGALDRFRPPGTFSFIWGPIYFYTLATACLFITLSNRKTKTWVLALAGISIAIACPVSISRTLVIDVLIVCAVGLAMLLITHRVSSGLIAKVTGAIVVVVAVATQLPVVSDALDAFNTRWYESTTAGGGVGAAIVDRFLDGLTTPITTAFDQPLLGNGLGIGTNVGAKLLTGEIVFLGGEAEWFRLIYELGPVAGVIYIGLRLAIVVGLLRVAHASWRRLNFVPAILLSAGALPMVQGQWGQPTSLGFSVFCGGLVLASARVPASDFYKKRRVAARPAAASSRPFLE